MSALHDQSDRRSGRVEPVPPNHEVTGHNPADKAPDSSATHRPSRLPAERSRKRVSRRRLLRLEGDLSDREGAVLRSLAELRFLSTGQLQRLHFADHATEGAASRICRRVLRRLCELRVIEHLDRRIGGIHAGSAAFVWRVGPVGDRLLRQAISDAARARHKQPSARYVDHVLAVAECYLSLVEASRAGRLELLAYQTEPTCWRPFLGAHGALETLKPDLYAVTATPEFEDSWFIEVDRGTESLPRLLRKCAQYERYRRLGREQAEHGVFPVVLWVMPDEARAEALIRHVRQRYGPDQELFRVTTTATFMSLIAGGADSNN